MESSDNKGGKEYKLLFPVSAGNTAGSAKTGRKEHHGIDTDLFKRLFGIDGKDANALGVQRPPMPEKMPSVVRTLPPPPFEMTPVALPRPVEAASVVPTLPPPAPKLIRQETAEKVRSALDEEIDRLRANARKFKNAPRDPDDEPKTEDMIKAAFEFDRFIKNLNMHVSYPLASVLTAFLFEDPDIFETKSPNDLLDYVNAAGGKLLVGENNFIKFLKGISDRRKMLVRKNLVIPEMMETFILTIKANNKKFEKKE